MERSAVVLVAALAAVVALVTALVVAVLMDDEPWSVPGVGMMYDDRRGAVHATSAATEADFLVEMIAHHEDAIGAAEELQRSDRPEMRALGEAVVATQTEQVDQMRAWLSQWHPDVSPDADYEPMMRDLSDLSGDELDRAFLDDMIPHHMTAVMMAQQLLVRDLAEHDEVAALARDIRDEQHDEILQMQEWRAEWYDEASGGRPGRGARGWMHR